MVEDPQQDTASGDSRSAALEIERKYLLDRLPALPKDAEAVRIEQGYLDLETDAGGVDVMTAEPAEVGGRVRRAAARDGADGGTADG